MIIATPTNYDDVGQFFDTSAVEDAIEHVLRVNPQVLMVIKSTVPVGYTDSVRDKYDIDNIIFSLFLRASTPTTTTSTSAVEGLVGKNIPIYCLNGPTRRKWRWGIRL